MDSGKKGRKRGRESESKEEDTNNNQDNRKKINLESVVVAKHDIGDGWLASMLECPVCLKVPRDLPIPSCPAGHIICKSCRTSVTTCPTCRRVLTPDGINSVVGSLIENVPHKCKFEVHGCQFKDVLGELKKHEATCIERTIKCPFPRCQTEVQLRRYKDHVIEGKCYSTYATGDNFSKTISTGFMQWDGISKNRGEEFDLRTCSIGSWIFEDMNDCVFYMKYYPEHRSLVFAVIMAKVPTEVEKYSATITIEKETMETSFKCPIIPIEQFSPKDDLISNDKCWSIHYVMFRKFFYFEDMGGPENHNWKVQLDWKVEITKQA